MAQGPEQGQRVIMVCLDYSEFSTEAFNYYYNNVHKADDYVIVMHTSCLHPPALPHAMASDDFHTKVKKHDERIKNFEVDWQKKLAKLVKGGKILVEAEGYSVGDTICKAANKNNVNMIVCGQRGMGIIRRTVMGSVSDYLLHHAHCPVLVVPKHHGDKAITHPRDQHEQETPQGAEAIQQQAQ